MKNWIIFMVLLIFYGELKSQTPMDALMMKKHELCIATIYQNDTWDQYWEGTLLRDNQNIGVLSRNTFMPMIAYGATNKLNIIAVLPYVITEATRGQMVGASGLQDFGIFAKYQAFDLKKSHFDYTGFIAGGFSLPASSYLSDYMPFSLGLGTKEVSARAIAKVEHEKGVYFRGSFAYLHRTTTEAERDFYYADGAYYTTTMDVPSATNLELALGAWLFGKKIQIEASYMNQTSLSGDDIRRQNAPQPTNKMDVTTINGRIRFFPSFANGLSIIGGYTGVTSGRNVGQSSIISGGLTYQFMLKKNQS